MPKSKKKDKWISIEYEGVTYRSVASCSKAIGIGKNVIYNGLKKGLNIYQIVDKYYNSGPQEQYLKSMKVKFMSLELLFVESTILIPQLL